MGGAVVFAESYACQPVMRDRMVMKESWEYKMANMFCIGSLFFFWQSAKIAQKHAEKSSIFWRKCVRVCVLLYWSKDTYIKGSTGG